MRSRRTILSLAALAVLGAVAAAPGAQAQTKLDGSEVKIGVIYTVDGVWGSYGVEGFRGVDYAADDLNAKGGIGGVKVKLVKYDNHGNASELPNIVRQLRKAHQGKRIELTVTNMQELDQALTAKVNVLLLENFPPGQVRQAIALVQGRAKVEITGKVGLDNARAYALAGVDYISVSQLTQSVKAFDFSFRVSR